MIELRSLYKVYAPSKEVKVEALKNINISFDTTGFVVLLGESGSGKSTLMNILAGLDDYTSGDMIIDGISTKRLKEKIWDEYRNKRVGVVFQDYSLLEEYTVRKNIKIALELQRLKNKKDWIDYALSRVGMEDKENKLVNRLSGGQKQRVAIARAIVKNPEIILADEPTGNLDSKNSEEIFELLEDISKDHLVMVITHNEELATKYADRVIRLVDGEIVEDKVVKKEEREELVKEVGMPPKGLPITSILSLGITNILREFFRFAATLVVFVMMLTMIGVGLGVNRYNKDETTAKALLAKSNMSLITIQNQKVAGETLNVITNEQKAKLIDEGYNIIPIYSATDIVLEKMRGDTRSNVVYVQGENIELKKHYGEMPNGYISMNDMTSNNYAGCKLLYGRWPESTLEICISRYTATVICEDSTAYCESPGYGGYSYIKQDVQDLVGKVQSLGGYNLKIVGIIDTGLEEYFYKMKEKNYNALIKELKGIHNSIFVTQNFIDFVLGYNNMMKLRMTSYTEIGVEPYISPHIQTGNTDAWTQSCATAISGVDCIKFLYGDDVVDQNEVVMSYVAIRNTLNGMESAINYTASNTPNETIDQMIRDGLNVTVGVIDTDTISEGGTVELTTYRVVGITTSNVTTRIISDSCDDAFNCFVNLYSTTLLIDNKNVTISKLQKLVDNYTICSRRLEDVENVNNRAGQIKVLGVFLALLFGVVSILMIYSFTASTIKDNYRRIGVLRALGATRMNINMIYLVEAILLAIMSVGIAAFALSPVTQFLEASSDSVAMLGVSVFSTEITDYLIIAAIAIILSLGSSLFATMKMTKKKPIEILKM